MNNQTEQKNLWDKIKTLSGKLGRSAMDNALYLWQALRDPNVPAELKGLAISALLYLVSPIDAVPDVLPGGLADDMVALAMAVNQIRQLINTQKS